MLNNAIDKVNPSPENNGVEVAVYVHMKVPPSEVSRWRAAALADKRSLTSLVRVAMDRYLNGLPSATE